MLNYAILFRALIDDFVDLGADRDFVVSFCRWFNPTQVNYVARVTEWQCFLCCGTAIDLTAGPLLVRYKIAQVWGRGFALRPDVSPFRIQVVHQCAMLFWKEEYRVDPDWTSYISRVSTSGRPDLEHPIIGKLAEWCKQLLGKAPSWDEILGTCGSGATAEHRTLRDRWFFDTTPLGIPCSFYQYNINDNHEQHGFIPYARASAVPKNRKSARIVASECASAMYAQLGLMKAFDTRLVKLGRRLPLRNADIHRRFLCSRSDLATLDLSDASDYISMELANAILPADWAALCNACRSQYVLVPGYGPVSLSTYAPMGNGFCFRVLSIVCAGVLAVTTSGTWSDFGDDMICLRSDVPFVHMGLDAVGLVLNESKSCYGRYVESCGLELFDGANITPLKIKRLLSWNENYEDIGAARRAASRYLMRLARACCVHTKPWKHRYNRQYQYLEERLPCWKARSIEYCCEGWPGMLRWLATRGENYANETEEYTTVIKGFRWCRCEDDALSLSDIEDISIAGLGATHARDMVPNGPDQDNSDTNMTDCSP